MDHSEVKHFPKVDHTPAELDDASTLLLKAAEVIERQGWCQCYIGTSDGQVCVEGALNVAAGRGVMATLDTHYIVNEACNRLRSAINQRALYEWNDKPARTKEEVVAKLRSVALGG